MNVKLFGTLRNCVPQYDPSRGIDIALKEGNRIDDLLDILGLPEGETKLFFAGGRARKLTHQLEDGDEVNIFLPLGGG